VLHNDVPGNVPQLVNLVLGVGKLVRTRHVRLERRGEVATLVLLLLAVAADWDELLLLLLLGALGCTAAGARSIARCSS
jgi:hypothetical protein